MTGNATRPARRLRGESRQDCRHATRRASDASSRGDSRAEPPRSGSAIKEPDGQDRGLDGIVPRGVVVRILHEPQIPARVALDGRTGKGRGKQVPRLRRDGQILVQCPFAERADIFARLRPHSRPRGQPNTRPHGIAQFREPEPVAEHHPRAAPGARDAFPQEGGVWVCRPSSTARRPPETSER